MAYPKTQRGYAPLWEYRELASQLVALPRGIFSGRLVFTVHLSFSLLQKSAAAARVPLRGVHKGEYTFTKLPLHSKARGHGRRLTGEKLRRTVKNEGLAAQKKHIVGLKI